MKMLIGAAILSMVSLCSIPAHAEVTWNVGPSIPVLTWEPGAMKPVSVLPGAGFQLSISDTRLERVYFGKTWDMLNLDLMAFGSLVRDGAGAQFGSLSVGATACTMSNLVCLGGGKRVLLTDGSVPVNGWFLLLAGSINFALENVLVAKGAALTEGCPVVREAVRPTNPKGNTLFW